MITDGTETAAASKRVGQMVDWSINFLVFASLLTFFATFGRSILAGIVVLLAFNAMALSWLAAKGLDQLLITFCERFPEFRKRDSVSVLRRKGVLMVPILILGSLFLCIVAVRLILDSMADSLGHELTPPSQMTDGEEGSFNLEAVQGKVAGMAILYPATVIMHFMAIAGVFYLLWARKTVMRALKEIEVMDDVSHAFRGSSVVGGAGNSWQS